MSKLTLSRLPRRVGTIEIDRLGALFAVRYPADLVSLLRDAGAAWGPGSRRSLLSGTQLVKTTSGQDLFCDEANGWATARPFSLLYPNTCYKTTEVFLLIALLGDVFKARAQRHRHTLLQQRGANRRVGRCERSFRQVINALA
jgi:hypothetical protein